MHCTPNRYLWLDVFCVFFGIGAWLSINGLWVQLPLLVEALPEGWNLASDLIVIIQVANIGPVLYSLLKYVKRDTSKAALIYTLLTIGCVSSLLLVFFWNRVVYIGGSKHSVALFVLVFFMSLVDCTSSVLFIPFMSSFPKKYLTSYLVGEGLSSFLPSIVALGQGVGGNPTCVNKTVVNVTSEGNVTTYVLEYVYKEARFPVQDFFIFLTIMMCLSGVAFFLLNVTPAAKEAMKSMERLMAKEVVPETVQQYGTADEIEFRFRQPVPLNPKLVVPFLGIIAVGCSLGNGILPAIQTFSCLPYGNVAYHLAVTLSSIANPLACSVAFFRSVKNPRVILGLTVALLVAAGYILATAVLSPSPPFVGTIFGEFLVVFSWITFVALLSYIKLSVATAFHHEEMLLFYYGAVTQVASAVGAFVMFVLVNYTHIFVSYNACISDVG